MPYAVTHILVAIILIELFRGYFIKDNKKFPRYYILIAALGGILLDLDYALVFILYPFGFTLEQIHPTYSHILLIPFVLFIAGVVIARLKIKNHGLGKRHMTLPAVFYILSATTLLHILLDFIFFGKLALFYPFSIQTFGLYSILLIPEELRATFLASLDAILLAFWIFWLEFKVRVRDYF